MWGSNVGDFLFLPAAKPSGPRTVGVVDVVVGVVGGSSLLAIGLKKLLVSVIQLPSQLKFRVGSVEINQNMSLLDQISLRGGIRHSSNKFLFGVGSLPFIYCTMYIPMQWHLSG